MSLPTEALRIMAEYGLSVDQIIRLSAAIEGSIPVAAETPRQARNARYYQSKRLNKTSETSEIKTPPGNGIKTIKTSETSETSEIKTPLARVEDNLSKIVDTCRTDAEEDASAWDRARLDGLTRRLREEAGEALEATSPNLLNVSPIVRLLRGGEGPRCELEADVIPAIRVISAKARRGSIRSWDYFRQASLENRDARLSGAPAGIVVDFAARAQGPSPGSYAAEEAEQSRIRAEVRKRLLEAP